MHTLCTFYIERLPSDWNGSLLYTISSVLIRRVFAREANGKPPFTPGKQTHLWKTYSFLKVLGAIPTALETAH